MESTMTRIMKFSSHKLFVLLLGLVGILSVGCVEDYQPTPQEMVQEYVVEGFIEAGEGSNLTYVLITESVPFLSTIELSTFEELFVNDAKVTVSDGVNSVQLTELCLNDLPDEIKVLAGEILGIDTDSTLLNICAYVDILNMIDRKEGGKYDLRIEIEEEVITASTTIPRYVPIFDERWDDPPGEPSDNIARLFVTIDDPGDESNYYRYQTEENGTGLIAPFQSVINDAFFNGQEFEVPLAKAELRDGNLDPDTFGFFYRGDTVRVKWMTLDEAHFNFWNTLEFSRNNSGPFSGFNRVSSNVEGALGIWGGYAVGYYEGVVPF